MRFFFTGPRIMGIRPGISLGASDFAPRRARATHGAPAEPMTGSFVYVIRGDHNMVKIGVSTNPTARLATLRTASAFPIDFAYIAATPGQGYDIEAGAHEMLKSHRVNGEWFDIAPEMAVAAIAGAAHKLRQPLMETSPEGVEQILAIATGRAPMPGTKAPRYFTMAKAAIAVWAIAAIIMIVGIISNHY